MSGRDERLLNTIRKLGQSYGLDVRGILHKPFRLADLRDVLEASREAGLPPPRATRVEELHRAIISGELRLHYQPKIDIATGTVAGCEALIRWLHPEHGLIPPGNFLPVAEEFGLLGAITRWVLDEALRQVGAWRMQGLDRGGSVNMPADMLHELPLRSLIQALLSAHAVAGDRLTLEVTEAAATKSLLTAVDVLARLRLMGVSLSIDDFGTGHSSIGKPRQLTLHEMKIDRMFLPALDPDPHT